MVVLVGVAVSYERGTPVHSVHGNLDPNKHTFLFQRKLLSDATRALILVD